MRRNGEAIRKWNATVTECQQIAKENPLPNGKQIVLENIFLLDTNATSEIHPTAVCPFLGKEAWVNHAGRYSNIHITICISSSPSLPLPLPFLCCFRFDPCCAPDKERRQLGDFGNVQEEGLMKLWKGEEYKKLVANYLDKYVLHPPSSHPLHPPSSILHPPLINFISFEYIYIC